MERVIELNRDEVALTEQRRRPGPAAAAWLAVLLILVLTGPFGTGPALAGLWRGVAELGFVWLTEDAIYTVDRRPAGLDLVRRTPSTGRVVWRYPLTGTLATLYRRGEITLASQFPPTPSLPTATRVTDAPTAAEIGTYPVPAMPLAYFAGDTALLIDRTGAPPPPVPARSNQFRSSPFFFTGVAEAHRITAIDLRTGSPRWERVLGPGTTWALPEVYPWVEGFTGADTSWLAVVHPDRKLEIWDVATGEARRRTVLGEANDWSYVVALHDTVVVTEQAWPRTMLRGYDATSLAQRWRFPVAGVPEATAWPAACPGALCMVAPSGVWAYGLDSGRPLWHYRVLDVFEDSQPLLAMATVEGFVQVEVATGEVRALPAPWRVVQTNPHSRALVVARTDDSGRSALGTLDQVTGALTPLGDVGRLPAVGRCQTAGAYLACVDHSDLRLWRIR